MNVYQNKILKAVIFVVLFGYGCCFIYSALSIPYILYTKGYESVGFGQFISSTLFQLLYQFYYIFVSWTVLSILNKPLNLNKPVKCYSEDNIPYYKLNVDARGIRIFVASGVLLIVGLWFGILSKSF